MRGAAVLPPQILRFCVLMYESIDRFDVLPQKKQEKRFLVRPWFPRFFFFFYQRRVKPPSCSKI